MNINLTTWFSDRQMQYLPLHFVTTNTEINDERLLWVLEKLVGRYYIGPSKNEEDWSYSLFNNSIIYFEDPHEALFFELTWS